MTKQGGDSWKQAAQGEKKLAEYWESQAAAERERADKAEKREQKLKDLLASVLITLAHGALGGKALNEQVDKVIVEVNKTVTELYPDKEGEAK